MPTSDVYRCPYDGFKVFQVGEGLYKCVLCDNYFREKDGDLVPYALRVYPYGGDVRKRLVVTGIARPKEEAQVKEVEGVFTITDFELKWVNGVASSLIPVRAGEGSNVTELRNKYRQGLIDVLKGKREMEDWINNTCVERTKKEIDVLMILERELSKHPEIRYNKEALAVRKQLRQRISGLR